MSINKRVDKKIVVYSLIEIPHGYKKILIVSHKHYFERNKPDGKEYSIFSISIYIKFQNRKI